MNGVIGNAIGIRCYWYQWHHITAKVIAPHFSCLDLGNAVVPLMMPSTWCDADMYQRHHMTKKVLLHLISIACPKKCNGAIDTVGIMWCWSQWFHMTKRDMLYIILFVFTCSWYHATLIMILMALCDTKTSCIIWSNTSGNCVTWPKNHVSSNFVCFNLRNVMVTLRMLTTACDAFTSAHDMEWQEKSHCTSFLSYWPKKCNDAIGIKWHWHWHQWHYITKTVILPLTRII